MDWFDSELNPHPTNLHTKEKFKERYQAKPL
jgi:hypothetical protein